MVDLVGPVRTHRQAGIGGPDRVITDLGVAVRVRTSPRVRTVRVALAGCGVVGGELVRRFQASREELAEPQAPGMFPGVETEAKPRNA